MEFTAMLLGGAVYILRSSNSNIRGETLNELYLHISGQLTSHPEAFMMLAGDYNHADPKTVSI